jgi:effector-binding domain-containing protein
MPIAVEVQTVVPHTLAAVRREIPISEIGSAWRPAISLVWDFLNTHAGLWADGHNTFLYHSDSRRAAIECDFGVEVTRTFDAEGQVRAVETPGGEAAVAVHRGPYERLGDAYGAIGAWMTAHDRESAGYTWEIYADPTPDPADTETTVIRLLTPL